MKAEVHQLTKTSAGPPTLAVVEEWNPLATDAAALRWSSYLGAPDGDLVSLLHPESPPSAAESTVHGDLRKMVLSADFPCLGARSSFHRRLYRFGVYPEMGSADFATSICHDLYEFAHELRDPTVDFATFVASFQGPPIDSESHFEGLFWAQLQHLHAADAQNFAWDTSVSNDPDDPWFSFSIGGQAFYIVGLHPRASRVARRFTHAAIVFNLHTQFAQLRQQGRLELFKQAIRARDVALQGSVNPTLVRYASGSQARQYSGRAVEPDWRCPLEVSPVNSAHVTG
jgi:FPC/CPF motif-containing protein YcgG